MGLPAKGVHVKGVHGSVKREVTPEQIKIFLATIEEGWGVEISRNRAGIGKALLTRLERTNPEIRKITAEIHAKKRTRSVYSEILKGEYK